MPIHQEEIAMSKFNIKKLPYKNPDGSISQEDFVSADDLPAITRVLPHIDPERLRVMAHALYQRGGISKKIYDELIAIANSRGN